jgi:hypothetical protein
MPMNGRFRKLSAWESSVREAWRPIQTRDAELYDQICERLDGLTDALREAMRRHPDLEVPLPSWLPWLGPTVGA